MKHTGKFLAILLAMAMVLVAIPLTANAAVAPGTPRNLKLIPGDTQITAEWDAPDDGGAAIIGYTLQFSGGGDDFQETVAGNMRSCTRKFLTNGTEYTVKVWAFNGDQSETPAQGKCTPGNQPVVAPGTPRYLQLTPGDQTIKVEWTAPVSDGGKPIAKYLIQFAIGGTAIAVVEVDGNLRSYLKDTLVNGQQYTVRVWAFNGAQSETPVEGTCTPTAQQVTPAEDTFKLWGKQTEWEKTPLNWFLCVALFGWIWMTFINP